MFLVFLAGDHLPSLCGEDSSGSGWKSQCLPVSHSAFWFRLLALAVAPTPTDHAAEALDLQNQTGLDLQSMFREEWMYQKACRQPLVSCLCFSAWVLATGKPRECPWCVSGNRVHLLLPKQGLLLSSTAVETLTGKWLALIISLALSWIFKNTFFN